MVPERINSLSLCNYLRYSVIGTCCSLLWVVLHNETISQVKKNLINIVFVLAFLCFTRCIYRGFAFVVQLAIHSFIHNSFYLIINGYLLRLIEYRFPSTKINSTNKFTPKIKQSGKLLFQIISPLVS